MDHRLREIEQWVAEAREDLGDGGQEAYLHKLYLLDAEIRAVIRENGVVPSAYSPVRTTDSVRRQSTRALALGGSFAVALLTAAAVLGLSLSGKPSFLASLRPQASPAATRPLGGQAVPLGSRVVLAGRSMDSGFTWQGLGAGSLEEELPEMPGETMMVFEDEAIASAPEQVPAPPTVILASAAPGQRELQQPAAQPKPATGRPLGREPQAQPAEAESPRLVEVLPVAMAPVEKEAAAEAVTEDAAESVLDAARIREDLERILGG